MAVPARMVLRTLPACRACEPEPRSCGAARAPLVTARPVAGRRATPAQPCRQRCAGPAMREHRRRGRASRGRDRAPGHGPLARPSTVHLNPVVVERPAVHACP
jgi:hypothetical protein